jgi:hypothetical protein
MRPFPLASWRPVRGRPRDARPNAYLLGSAATRLDGDVWLDISVGVICSQRFRWAGRSARRCTMWPLCHMMVARLDFGTRASVLRRSFQRSFSTQPCNSSWVNTPRHHRRVGAEPVVRRCLIHGPVGRQVVDRKKKSRKAPELPDSPSIALHHARTARALAKGQHLTFDEAPALRRVARASVVAGRPGPSPTRVAPPGTTSGRRCRAVLRGLCRM